MVESTKSFPTIDRKTWMANDETDSSNEETATQKAKKLDAQRRKEVMPYREHLWDSLFSSYAEFDRAILTLSSALLALSIAFVKDIVPIEQISLPGLLVASWILFGVSILSTLTSFISHSFRERFANCRSDLPRSN